MITEKNKKVVLVLGVLFFIFGIIMVKNDLVMLGLLIGFLGLVIFTKGIKPKEQMEKDREHKLSTKKQVEPTKQDIAIVMVGLFVLVGVWITNPTSNTTSPEKTTVSTEDKQKALKNFTDSLNLMKEGGIITSYDFSETSNVIYVSTGWYTMPVQQKKDFLTSLSSMKQVATGYHRLEVRDAYSNEKVAEVTALSGSVEILK